jgi:NTP pyrophosphatase (non-canonical NTP hydrolase)
MPNLNDLCRDAFETAKSKGFWEGHRAFGELLMLVVSEASEALEDYRHGRRMTEIYHETGTNGLPKPCGIPTELADIVIRVADICGAYGIDLEAAVAEKMAYNATRPRKHGGMKA